MDKLERKLIALDRNRRGDGGSGDFSGDFYSSGKSNDRDLGDNGGDGGGGD